MVHGTRRRRRRVTCLVGAVHVPCNTPRLSPRQLKRQKQAAYFRELKAQEELNKQKRAEAEAADFRGRRPSSQDRQPRMEAATTHDGAHGYESRRCHPLLLWGSVGW